MFNNQIYGLTKGQYSPTSELGKVTKSTPFGSLDHPFNPLSRGARRRGELRGPHPRHGPRPHDRDVPAGPRAQGRGLRRGLPELQRLQRRAPSRASPRKTVRDEMLIPLAPRRADPLRCRGRARRGARRPGTARGSSRWPTSARTRSSSTTRRASTRAWPSCSPGWPAGPTSRRRSACSGPSSASSTAPRSSRQLADADRSRRAPATWRRSSAAAPPGRSSASSAEAAEDQAGLRLGVEERGLRGHALAAVGGGLDLGDGGRAQQHAGLRGARRDRGRARCRRRAGSASSCGRQRGEADVEAARVEVARVGQRVRARAGGAPRGRGARA